LDVAFVTLILHCTGYWEKEGRFSLILPSRISLVASASSRSVTRNIKLVGVLVVGENWKRNELKNGLKPAVSPRYTAIGAAYVKVGSNFHAK
jgi:hypothetical protein